jgi:hypothetical protein
MENGKNESKKRINTEGAEEERRGHREEEPKSTG